MKISRRAIAQVLADKTLKSGVNNQIAREIAAYLLKEGRSSELNSLLRDIQADWAKKGAISVFAVSAHKLSDNNIGEITKEVRKIYPGAKQINIIPEIEADLMGGVQLRFADQILDLSIVTKLNKFKQLTAAGTE